MLVGNRAAGALSRARITARAGALVALLLVPLAVQAGGTLVIAGGALAEDNGEVYRAYADALPADGQVVLIPAASGRPARALEEAGRLAAYTFSEAPDTRGYWRTEGGGDRYQLSRVRLDIERGRWQPAKP